MSDGGARPPAVTRRVALPPHALREVRAGAGTPVVLLHGLSGSSRWWSRNLDALAARHLVAAVDLSRLADLPYSEITALVGRWLETFDQPVHLFGHSMGGQFAIGVAARHPQLVRSLVLVDAAGMPFRFAPLAHVRPLEKPPYGGATIARVLVPDFMRAGPAAVAVAGARVVMRDMRELMHAIRVPTLLVWGENDPLVPLAYGEAMQQEIEGSRLVVIPNAAHVPMWERPEEFNDIALQFVDEVESLPPRPPGEPAFGWGLAGFTDGIAHRQAGRRRDLVLVHGLGMSSAYFEPFARALFDRGWNPIAPDLPGFGESANAPAAGAEEHVRVLAAWAEQLGIPDAVWIGHSIGCNAVAHLPPSLVRAAVFIGPLWTRSPHPQVRLVGRFALDALREPVALYPYVLRAYWRTGLWRWWRTWRAYLPDTTRPPTLPARSVILAGERDPIPDPGWGEVVRVVGAHACVFSHPEETAEAIRSAGIMPAGPPASSGQ